MEKCTRCKRPSQRELCVLCQHETEMARRAALTAPAHAAHINPLSRIERDQAEAQHG